MATTTTRDLRPLDKVRRSWFLARLSMRLVGLPGRMERDIRSQLKVDITDAATEHGMAQALAQLGRPHILAEEYLSAHGRPVPKVWTGIVVFALITYGGLFAMISVIEGLVDGALAANPAATVEISKTWLLSRAEVKMTDGILDSLGFTLTGWGLLVLFLVPLVCTRFWRMWAKPTG